MTPTDDHGVRHGLQHHEPLYTDALHNEDVAHEHSDVDVRALLIFCAGLLVTAAVVHLSMWGLFVVFERMAAKNDPVLSPHAIPAGQLPPEPRLLTNEYENLQKHRQMEREALGTGGTAPAGALPISEAKKLLLQRGGAAARPNAPADPWIGTRASGPASGESSSGRAIPLRPAGAAPPDAAPPPAPPPAQKGH